MSRPHDRAAARAPRWRAGLSRALAAAAIFLVAIGPGGPEELRAQETEAELLREAGLFEVRGELDRARAVLESLLDDHPASPAGLFALERVLRGRGALAEILPRVERAVRVAPDQPAPRFLELRVLGELGRGEELDRAAEAWMERRPDDAEPYREVARIYRQFSTLERARAVLERGREAGAGEELSLEIGDLREEAGDPVAAVREWTRALGPGGERFTSILRRIALLSPDVRRGAALPFVETHAAAESPDRRRAAAVVAVETGWGDRAVDIAEGLLPELAPDEARGLLLDLGSRADQRGEEAAALSIWDALAGRTDDPDEAVQLERRIASAALAVGDTARALTARRRIAAAAPEGSETRGRAEAGLLELRVAIEPAAALVDDFLAFRTAHPELEEVDRLGAAIAAGLSAAGEMEGAGRVIEGLTGPEVSRERAYLHLERGELVEAIGALRQAARGVPPAEATEILALATALAAADRESGAVLAESAVVERRQGPTAAAARLESSLEVLDPARRPAILARAARLRSAAGDAEGARALWARLVTEHPEAVEAPGALLAWARSEAARGRADEAVALLERLILERPGSAVVPAARRELERLRNEAGSTGEGSP